MKRRRKEQEKREEKRQLEEELKEKTTENESLRAEKRRLEEQLEAKDVGMDAKRATFELRMKDMQIEFMEREAREEKAELETKIYTLEKMVKAAEDQSKRFQERADYCQSKEMELREKNEKLTKENYQLTEECAKLQQSKHQLKRDKGALLRRNDELEDFKEVCVAMMTGERLAETTVHRFFEIVGSDNLQLHAAVTLGLDHLVGKMARRHSSLLAVKNGRGWTPLQLAVARGDTRVIKALWEARASMYATPPLLHLAAANQHRHAAKILRQYNVDKTAEYRGVTARDVAAALEDEPLAQVIDKRGFLSCFVQPAPRRDVGLGSIEELLLYPSTSASSPETMPGSGRGPRHRSGRGSSQVSRDTTASKECLLSSDGDPRDLENGSVEVEDRRQREGNGRTRMVDPPVAVKRTRDEAEAAGTEGLQPKRGRKVEERRSDEESCAGALAQPLPQGLPNLGNTCYMNSVLQCLYHVDSLTARLRKLQIDPGHGGVVRATVQLLKALQGGASLDNSVRALKNAMAKRDPNFRDFEQKEAHDFYSQLLNFLHTDILAAENGRTNMGAGSLIEMQEPESFISHLFRIVHLTKLTCPKDPPYDLSTNTEAAFNISLPVSRSGPFSLKELLARYYRQQSLDWDCDRCGTEHECQNSVLVTRQPSVLVLHLSRVSEMEMSAHKCQVTYPMKGLTMPHVTDSTRRSYRLTAVCCHEGGMQSGHYTAFCRRGDHWYSFNDKFVRSVPKSESVLNKPSAHILFYEAEAIV